MEGTNKRWNSAYEEFPTAIRETPQPSKANQHQLPLNQLVRDSPMPAALAQASAPSVTPLAADTPAEFPFNKQCSLDFNLGGKSSSPTTS